MKKVLYVIDSLQIGGSEKSLLDIASNLHDIEPVVCHLYVKDTLKDSFERAGIKVISLEVKSGYGFYEAGKKLFRVIREEKPDLVVASLLRSELVSRVVCFLARVPLVGTFVNNAYSSEAWQSFSKTLRLKRGVFRMLNVITARLCKGFIANSESIKENNCKALLVSEKKVQVIHRGRSSKKFSFKPHQSISNPPKFLSVGRLLPGKGFQDIIHAFKLIEDEFPDARLTIAGEGPYRKKLEALITSLALQNRVKLVGSIDNVADRMHDHDVFVFASHHEGFSGTVVEAMMAGIPIVASDIPMNLEAVTEQSARIFPVKDRHLLAKQMINSLRESDKSYQMSLAARKMAEHSFDIAAIASEHERYYQVIIARHPVR